MKNSTISLFLIALFLFAINVFGLFVSLRNPAIYHEPNNYYINDITLTEDQLNSIINNAKTESREALAIELTDAVNMGIAHYWQDGGIEKYNLRVPFYENYLLFLAGYLYPEKFRKYEFTNVKKAIERGVGECSQQAIILYEALKRKNIEAVILGLHGHVVVMALIDEIAGQWWTLDPDNGVVIEHGINEIEEKPEIIKKYYANKGIKIETIRSIINAYRMPGNQIYSGTAEFLKTNYLVERIFYLLIWLIPCALSAPFVLNLIRRRTSSK
jgi:hypothetical protein